MTEVTEPGILLVGHPRSGVELLAAMLDEHPRIAAGPETSFFDLLGTVPGAA